MPRTPNPSPSQDEIDFYHKKYCQELMELYDDNKNTFDIGRRRDLVFVD